MSILGLQTHTHTHSYITNIPHTYTHEKNDGRKESKTKPQTNQTNDNNKIPLLWAGGAESSGLDP